jgi:hypothetical protein
MAFLITCAGLTQVPEVFNPSLLQNLSFNESLLEARLHIMDVSGIHLDWNYTLPAWNLYSGNGSRLSEKYLKKIGTNNILK